MTPPAFKPREHVRVTLLELNCPGRVSRSIWDGLEWCYAVEYADDRGELCNHEFYGDELERKA